MRHLPVAFADTGGGIDSGKEHLEQLAEFSKVKPAVNQIEVRLDRFLIHRLHVLNDRFS
jgi:hypothetical protein